MYESMCSDSRLSENFPIIYKTNGWVNCGLWMNVSWMSFSWLVCRGWRLLNMYVVISWMNIPWVGYTEAREKQVIHNNKYKKTGDNQKTELLWREYKHMSNLF